MYLCNTQSKWYTFELFFGILLRYHLHAIGGWHWLREGEERSSSNGVSYEQALLNHYNSSYSWMVFAPGSGSQVKGDDWEVLGKVLKKMVS